jgi:hypothetical protein
MRQDRLNRRDDLANLARIDQDRSIADDLWQ